MFTTLHGGAVNLGLHLTAIPVLLAGLAQRRVGWIVIAGMMAILGHAWNMLFRFDRGRRRTALRVLPLQLFLTAAVFLLLLGLFGWL
jgi:glycerol-3-phosphate acyltransferase PlsY